jgi:hypothetical protein
MINGRPIKIDRDVVDMAVPFALSLSDVAPFVRLAMCMDREDVALLPNVLPKFGVKGIGGAIDIALRAALRNHGLQDKRDVTIVEGALPSMKAMLMEHKVDLIPAVIPFAHDPELIKVSRLLFTQGESVGRTQTLLWAARFCRKTEPQWSILWKTYCGRVGSTLTPKITRKRWKSFPILPDSHPSSLKAEFLPTRTIIGIRMPSPTWQQCNPISPNRRNSAF